MRHVCKKDWPKRSSVAMPSNSKKTRFFCPVCSRHSCFKFFKKLHTSQLTCVENLGGKFVEKNGPGRLDRRGFPHYLRRAFKAKNYSTLFCKGKT
jgi:hypothetical protein